MTTHNIGALWLQNPHASNVIKTLNNVFVQVHRFHFRIESINAIKHEGEKTETFTSNNYLQLKRFQFRLPQTHQQNCEQETFSKPFGFICHQKLL